MFFKRTGTGKGNVVADNERFDSLLQRAKLQVTRRTFLTWITLQSKMRCNWGVWSDEIEMNVCLSFTFILQEPDFGRESRAVLFKHFT